MKKAILVLAILLIATTAYANRGWDPCENELGSQLWNRCAGSEKTRAAVGAELEVVLYEGDEGDILNEARADIGYDWQNGQNSYMIVGKSKLVDIKDGVVGLFNKIKGIFKKEQ